jgi:hypothetical protein
LHARLRKGSGWDGQREQQPQTDQQGTKRRYATKVTRAGIQIGDPRWVTI